MIMFWQPVQVVKGFKLFSSLDRSLLKIIDKQNSSYLEEVFKAFKIKKFTLFQYWPWWKWNPAILALY